MFHSIIMHQTVIKKSQAVSIWEYCLIVFVTPSDHCVMDTLLLNFDQKDLIDFPL